MFRTPEQIEREAEERRRWWWENERPRPLSECSEVSRQLAASIRKQYASDDAEQFGVIVKHVGPYSDELVRIGGTGKLRFDWTYGGRRARKFESFEHEYLYFTMICLGCREVFARPEPFVRPLSYCSNRCRMRKARGSFAERDCASCGATITRGRYCSNACRQRAYRRRSAA